MKLKFKNIGRFINDTELEINGITVIAGKNGTGKSTINKILYCLFDTFHYIEASVCADRAISIARLLKQYFGDDKQENDYDDMAEHLATRNVLGSVEELLEDLYSHGFEYTNLGKDEISQLYLGIKGIMDVSVDEIMLSLLNKRIKAEFGEQLKHVNYESEDSYAELDIKDKKIKFIYKDKLEISDYISLRKDIVYMDDLTSIENFQPSFKRSPYSHEESLHQKILNEYGLDQTAIGEILASNRYKKILDKFNEANVGSLVIEGKRDFEYSNPGLENNIKVQNISAGTKVMLVFKRLLENAYLEENGTMVLDEPEVHMHPEWQYALAEIIVLLQVELGIHIVLSTHSADFILFIEYFSKKYNIEDKCKYYLLEEDDGYSTKIIDVTEDNAPLYDSISTPYIRVTEEMSGDEVE